TFEDLQGGIFPKRADFGVIVCFDDCFRDNYEVGRAVLESQGVRGVFFQTSGLVDRRDLLWEHALYWVNRSRATRERLRQLGYRILNAKYATLMRHFGNPVYFLRDHVPFTQTLVVLQSAAEMGDLKLEFELPGYLYPGRHHVREAHQAGH